MTMRDAGKCSRCNLVSSLGFNIIFQILQCDYFHILFSTAKNLCKCILKAQDLNHVTDITRLFIRYMFKLIFLCIVHQCYHLIFDNLNRRLKFFFTRPSLPFYIGNPELFV